MCPGQNHDWLKILGELRMSYGTFYKIVKNENNKEKWIKHFLNPVTSSVSSWQTPLPGQNTVLTKEIKKETHHSKDPQKKETPGTNMPQ